MKICFEITGFSEIVGYAVVPASAVAPPVTLPAGDWVLSTDKGGVGWTFSDGYACPTWVPVLGAGGGPPGAEDGYQLGARVWHDGLAWVSATPGNVWAPGFAGWHRLDGTWRQPTGAADAYPLGAEVEHAGASWVSGYAANVWEPGVFGWSPA